MDRKQVKRTDLILPSEALPNQCNHTVSLNKAGHTHTHFYNAQGPESTCNIVMGVDLSGWLLGDCPKKSQKQIPSPDRCGNNATPSICQGLHRVTVFTPPGEQDYQLNITGLCLGTFH